MKAVDITGKRYGRLLVLSKEKNNAGGRTCWLCQCDCGNQCIVTTHELNAGKTKSCGCLRRDNLRKRLSDITNKKFGRLTALYPMDKRDKKGSVYWHCRCDCGNEVDVTYDSLAYGNYRSCGCYRQENMELVRGKLIFIDDTCVDLLQKRKLRCDNTSGFRGVSMRENGKWRAHIGLQSKRYNIGTYDTFEEAVEARLEAERILHDGFVDEYEKWSEKAKTDTKWAEDNPFYFKVEKTENGFIATTPLSRLQTNII